MTKKDWFIILVMYFSFWIYLAIDKYQAKKRFEESIKIDEKTIDVSCGDKIITVAGIYGEISDIQGETVIIKLEDESTMKISRNSILNKVM
ncbi:MAG: preprotein translocase subunit YajC [Anaerococcus prevotii]|uniref:preprotein translocase subunit YajC n=1 Tax=Anaerococcus prevotii TaxID=33034 RepID=UPI002902C8EA|nr:preprotein translocase subunit YajC [Anaerococcus prevotii]MDU2557809.1 preprotein translocase subunit YajC [Anaerococcus prevotii]